MPGPWNDTTDRKLLLTIIHLTAPQLPKWDQVAGLMGEGFTAESTRQHFQKLRKECKAELEGASPVPNGGTPTPRKPKAKAANGETPSKSTGKRKARKENDDDDEEEMESPTKKQAVKKEEDGGEVGDFE